MKRRFHVTLLAVAIAVVGSSAFAMAPVINSVRSPVIADDTPSTDANVFVYPDALDADTLASDPDSTVTPDGIIWSYYSATGNYQINGRDSLDPGNIANDPNNPTSAQELGPPGATYDSALDDPDAVDSNLRTLTFRDAGYSPIGGPNVDPTPGDPTSSVVRQEVVTLFASDGSSWSMRNVMVYTESNGRDRLSSTGEEVLDQIPSIALGWVSTDYSGGSLTFSDSSGLCIQAPGPGAGNFGQWLSPYGIVDLVQNAVYRVRLTLDSNATPLPANTTPFWDFVIDNYDGATAQNKYAADFMNIDNEGGANSVGLSTTTGRGTFDIWYTPPAVLATDWNDPTTGQFTTAADPDNDMRMNFRILDVISTGFDGSGDAGTVCLRNVNVTRFDMSEMTVVGAALYDVSTISATTHVVSSIFGTANTTTNFSGGNVTIQPNTGGAAGPDAWDLEVIQFDPGNATIGGAENVDNWPVVWESDKLLMGTLTVQAPDATADTNPVDVISLTWDTPTNEMLLRTEVYATSNTNGLPKQAAPTDLVSFFYTHNETASTGTEFNRIRMRVLLLLTTAINSGNSANNLGGIQIQASKIEEIAVP